MSNGKGQYDFDFEIVELVDEGENRYGIKAVAILKKNRSAEDGAQIEFFVSGKSVGIEQTDENGRAMIDISITTFAISIVVEALMKDFPHLRRKATRGLRGEKREAGIRVIKLNEFAEENDFTIILARATVKGDRSEGSISYFDPAEKKIKQVSAENDGFFKIRLKMQERMHSIKVFPTEKLGPEYQSLIDVPAKETRQPKPKTKNPKPQKKKASGKKPRKLSIKEGGKKMAGSKLVSEIYDWVKRDVMGAVVGGSIRDIFRHETRETGSVLAGRLKKTIEDNPRAELLYVLLSLEPKDAKVFWQRHMGAIRSGIPGAENDFVRILGRALPKDPSGKLDMENMERAKKVYTQIARMDEAEFCQVMEELNHDPIAQYIKFWLKKGKGLAEAIWLAGVEAAGRTWPWLTASTPAELKRFPETAALVRRIKRHNREKERSRNWLQKLMR